MKKELHDWARDRSLLMAVEATIAILVSYVVCMKISTLYSFPFPPIAGLWGGISAIFILSDKRDEVFKSSRARAYGTLIGTLVPLVLVYILDGYSYYMFGISVFVTVFVCSMIGLREIIHVACITLIVVVAIGWWRQHEIVPWLNALSRLFESLIGIVVSLLLDLIFYPIRRRYDLF